ncbi:INCREASED PETAL GROWTH ANISOTROPY 1-like protein 1 [Silene latifolia]|uniref:INCREASED PETAL GROWTH ANISOTROPY 1-like protein 1 n=1 Tax=Silene latifolia TaxID=37657 RepID=UPI003D76EAE0
MEKNSSEITFLVEDIEAILEMNTILEKENQELKHEVVRLKSQISSLKAHDIERKSILWKKIQFPINNGNKDEVRKNAPPDYTEFGVSVSPKMVYKEEMVLKGPPPPPPPPLPSKLHMGPRLAVRRMPEVIEFYRCLNKRNVLVEKRVNVTGSVTGENSPRNMIGEIENRSTYLSAVKSDVETQREFICFLIEKVQTAAFKDIADVDAFVKWLDGELSCLVDERAVLKHFPEWPERKTDGLREAAGLYRDLKGIESKILNHKDDPKQLLHQSLGRIQLLQDRRIGASNK